MPRNFADEEQFGPLNVVGPKGQHAFMGLETIFFEGSTGLVGTAYGIPGVTATRTSTGCYRINYGSAPQLSGAMGVIINPIINAPSGASYQVNVSDVNSVTGVANIQIGRTGAGHLSHITTQTFQVHNPVSGTKLHLQFFVSPVTPF